MKRAQKKEYKKQHFVTESQRFRSKNRNVYLVHLSFECRRGYGIILANVFEICDRKQNSKITNNVHISTLWAVPEEMVNLDSFRLGKHSCCCVAVHMNIMFEVHIFHVVSINVYCVQCS